MKKRDTTRLIDALVQRYGATTISLVLDTFKDLGFQLRDAGRRDDLEERRRRAAVQGARSSARYEKRRSPRSTTSTTRA